MDMKARKKRGELLAEVIAILSTGEATAKEVGDVIGTTEGNAYQAIRRLKEQGRTVVNGRNEHGLAIYRLSTKPPKAKPRKQRTQDTADRVLAYLKAHSPSGAAHIREVLGGSGGSIAGALNRLKKAGQIESVGNMQWAVKAPSVDSPKPQETTTSVKRDEIKEPHAAKDPHRVGNFEPSPVFFARASIRETYEAT